MARRPRSLMLTFMEADTAENGTILCTEVLNALIEADIQKDSIEGIEAPRRNKYFVVFKEFASRRLNINKRIQIREKWYRLEHPNPSPQYTSKTRVRIFYYPLDEDTKNLEIVLKHYGLFSEGSIKDLERETETEKEEAEKTNTMETENEEKTTEQSKETAAEKENTSKETAPAKPEEKENTNEKDEKETERNLETDEKKEDSDSTTLGEESEESDGNREKDTKWQVVGKRKRNNRKTTTKAKKESVEQGAGKKSEPPETKL